MGDTFEVVENDQVSVADELLVNVLEVEIGDTVSVSDVLTPTAEPGIATDSVSVTDSLGLTFEKAFDDAAVVTDSISITTEKVLGDAVAVTDQIELQGAGLIEVQLPPELILVSDEAGFRLFDNAPTSRTSLDADSDLSSTLDTD